MQLFGPEILVFCQLHPGLAVLLYIWFGAWSLGYFAFLGGIPPAKEALVDWIIAWEDRGWFPQDLPLWLALLMVALWPATWCMIIRYWK